jgi:hypothetical protein
MLQDEWSVKLGDWTLVLKPELLHAPEYTFFDSLSDCSAQFFSIVGYNDRDGSYCPPRGLEHSFLPLSSLLLCPFVTLQASEFRVEGEKRDVTVTFPKFVQGDGIAVSFSSRALGERRGEWRVSEDGSKLHMCVDLYNHVFSTLVTPQAESDRVVVEAPLTRRVVSGVCGILSVLCLFLTLVTYSLFSCLRALPGLNNMGLSTSLGLAQLSLLIPWYRTCSVVVCRLVGIVTHWLWLQALSWMAVCCTHMARVFASKVRLTMTMQQTRRKFLLNLAITLLTSTAVVGVMVGVAEGVSGGSSIGYGGALCFLDTASLPLLVLAFALPLGLVILTDLVCFVFTVVSIARVRRLQSSRSDEAGARQHQAGNWRDVLVYAKLVTVTGGAWALGLATEAADSEWMRVVAELLTGAQGLLIFLAYVCNQRVWDLYKRLWYGDSDMTVVPSTTVSVSRSG